MRIYITGFSKPNVETRYGDGQVIIHNNYCLIIDGFCGEGTDKLISYLKHNKIKKVYLAVSHWHYDHFYGIRKIINDDYFTVVCLYCYNPQTLVKGLSNNKGSASVREDIKDGNKIIQEAKSKGIKIKYLKNGDKVVIGKIKFNVYREQPSRVADNDTSGWAYVNDGSLCFYFPEISYFTSGDGSEKIYDLCKKNNIKPKWFKIPHHGNNCPQSQAWGMRSLGALVCWYNDLEPNGIGTTDFTAYGARRCKQAGIKVLDSIGDINFIAYNGKAFLYHKGKCVSKFTVDFKDKFIDYHGNVGLKAPVATIVRHIFQGKYGSGDNRITKLLDIGYYPNACQKKLNKVIELAKGILKGKLNYGKGDERIKKIDAELGKGFGQLVQDEINVLAGIKKW